MNNNDHGKLDELCVNAIRMLAVDAVEKAKSGHPGMPLGAAPMAYVLWTKFLRHNPMNPAWFNRDRFVLSAGHGSALLYAMLHLTGYDLSLDDLKKFRSLHSRTPGHPEYGLTPGVEATTGPLGQGFAMGVGMAIAEDVMGRRFNKKDFRIVDHYTYAIVSDGDLMEGVASEAASLAGTLKLGKLIYLYDDNHISIEGDTSPAFNEDVLKRFAAYGWHTSRVADGENLDAIEEAIAAAQRITDRPSLIAVRTHIGAGSPKQDNASVHGEPLGADAVKATKKFYNWPEEPFFIPKEVLEYMQDAIASGSRRESAWNEQIRSYRNKYPADAGGLDDWLLKKPRDGYDVQIPKFDPAVALATREAGGIVMNAIAAGMENFIGGSADLAPSTKTNLNGFGDVGTSSDTPRNIHFGVREHAMGAIVNGVTLHGGLRAFSSTFLVFSDYMRPAIRLAALMNIPSIFIFTHDSVGLGEDGPTHQPIEQLMSLRLIPNLIVIRPADANETAAAWRVAMESAGPVALALSRQKVPTLDAGKYSIADGVKRGAYILSDSGGAADIIIIATGSEVHLALAAKDLLEKENVNVRVVSMPSWELFEKHPAMYRDKVLLPQIKKRIAIEAGAIIGWLRYVGDEGIVIGIDRFGLSAPGDQVMKELGIDVQNIVNAARKILKQ